LSHLVILFILYHYYYSLSLRCHYPHCDPRFDSCQAPLAGGGYVLPFPLSPFG